MKLRDERGSVTVEAALSLATLMIVAAAIVAACATMAAQIAATDIAGAAARAHAIGVDYSVANADIAVSEAEGVVTVSVTKPAAIGRVTAQVSYPVEYR